MNWVLLLQQFHNFMGVCVYCKSIMTILFIILQINLFTADDDDVMVQRRIATVQVCLTLSNKFEPSSKTASITKLFIK